MNHLKEVAGKLNNFFVPVGPNLAENIPATQKTKSNKVESLIWNQFKLYNVPQSNTRKINYRNC